MGNIPFFDLMNVRRCPDCGAELRRDDKFCPKCGKPMFGDLRQRKVEYKTAQLDWSSSPFIKDYFTRNFAESSVNANQEIERRVQDFLNSQAADGWELDGILDPEGGAGSALQLITRDATSFWGGGNRVKIIGCAVRLKRITS